MMWHFSTTRWVDVNQSLKIAFAADFTLSSFYWKKGVYKAHFRHSCKSFLYILLDYVLTQWVLTCFFLSCYTNRILHSSKGVKSIQKYNLFCIITLSLSHAMYLCFMIFIGLQCSLKILKQFQSFQKMVFANQFKTFRTNFVHTWVPTSSPAEPVYFQFRMAVKWRKFVNN